MPRSAGNTMTEAGDFTIVGGDDADLGTGQGGIHPTIAGVLLGLVIAP